MTRGDLIKSMRETAGGDWISKRRLRKWLQSGDAEAAEILEGLDYRVQGRATLYFVPDVVERVRLQIVRAI